MEIRENFLETMGNTPIVALRRYHPDGALLAAKLEFFNPGSSVKDRIGIAMIEAAEREGKLRPGMTIVEPTSGNTGLGLAIAALLRGYKLICTASEKITKEKVAMLEAHGAEVVVCPVDVEPDDPRSYTKTAERIRDEQGAFLPYQYFNQANPLAHYETTGPEIWRQTDGRLTHFVAGIGTGGTISGAGRYLKEQNPAIRVVGVDPVGSVYAHFVKHGRPPSPEELGLYLIDGIGQSYIPESYWPDAIDDVVTVDDRTAYREVFALARSEGIFTGSSGGAAAFAAREVARGLDPDAIVITLLPDSGERYLSKLNAEWMRQKGLTD
ncbi:MAG TPA: cysteine synthase family protein [Thermoanaerobaculia bacterium]|nr:cysteine synthase family protein [Thermoanaerobaculia bacterium]